LALTNFALTNFALTNLALTCLALISFVVIRFAVTARAATILSEATGLLDLMAFAADDFAVELPLIRDFFVIVILLSPEVGLGFTQYIYACRMPNSHRPPGNL
jgi:hypothetical protein